MKKCSNCSSSMKKMKSKMPEGIPYTFYKCTNCGEEVVDMRQLQDLASGYRNLKRYQAKVARWGMSLGVRIPKELAARYDLKDNSMVTMIPEKEGIKIILA